MLDGSRMAVVMVGQFYLLWKEILAFNSFTVTFFSQINFKKWFFGYCSISENSDYFGNRYIKGNDKSTRLIFGNDGIIAGIQATVSWDEYLGSNRLEIFLLQSLSVVHYLLYVSTSRNSLVIKSNILVISNVNISSSLQFIPLDQSQRRGDNSHSILP